MRISLSRKAKTSSVSVVTTAGLSHTDDRLQRQRRYAVTQSVRIACFVLAVVLPIPLGFKLAMLAAALLLPLMGVVSANAGPVVVRKQRSTAIVDRAVTASEVSERLILEPGRVVDAER